MSPRRQVESDAACLAPYFLEPVCDLIRRPDNLWHTGVRGDVDRAAYEPQSASKNDSTSNPAGISGEEIHTVTRSTLRANTGPKFRAD